MIDERLDRSTIKVTTFEQADADDIAFWMSKTPAERVEGIEYLRRWLYGEDQVNNRLQRVLTAVELGAD